MKKAFHRKEQWQQLQLQQQSKNRAVVSTSTENAWSVEVAVVGVKGFTLNGNIFRTEQIFFSNI